MDVYSITSAGLERRPVDDLKLLLEQPDALTWVDLPICQAGEAAVLSDLFGFHDLADPRLRRTQSHLEDARL